MKAVAMAGDPTLPQVVMVMSYSAHGLMTCTPGSCPCAPLPLRDRAGFLANFPQAYWRIKLV